MRKLGLLVLLIAFAVSFSGCPDPAPDPGNALVGTWEFVIEEGDALVTLQPNGEAISEPNGLTGTLTWRVIGDQFVMDQTFAQRIIYSALIENNGSELTGAWVFWQGANIGLSHTFTAVKQ